jgi:hypothetical protein
VNKHACACADGDSHDDDNAAHATTQSTCEDVLGCKQACVGDARSQRHSAGADDVCDRKTQHALVNVPQPVPCMRSAVEQQLRMRTTPTFAIGLDGGGSEEMHCAAACRGPEETTGAGAGALLPLESMRQFPHACDATQFPCIRAAVQSISSHVQLTATRRASGNFRVMHRYFRDAVIKSADSNPDDGAHASSDTMRRFYGHAALNLSLRHAANNASPDRWQANGTSTAVVLCSQHLQTPPQNSGDEGALGAPPEGQGPADCRSRGDIALDAENRGDAGGCDKNLAQHEPFKCSKCEEDRQKKKRLLGESGEAYEAAMHALKKIQDVHTSDELMHFEFWGPFWELSEVRRNVFCPASYQKSSRRFPRGSGRLLVSPVIFQAFVFV